MIPVPPRGPLGAEVNSGELYARQRENRCGRHAHTDFSVQKGDARSAPWEVCDSLILDYLQVVVHFENPRDAVGSDVGKVLVALTVDNTFESDTAVLDNNSNRLLHSERVLLQGWILIDRPEQAIANPIVRTRWR